MGQQLHAILFFFLKEPDGHPSPGSTLYIDSQEGSTLVVATVPPR